MEGQSNRRRRKIRHGKGRGKGEVEREKAQQSTEIIKIRNVLLNLLPNFHSPVLNHASLIPSEPCLLLAHEPRALQQLRDRDKIEITREVIKKGTTNPHQWPLRILHPPLLHRRQSSVVDDDFVESGFYESPCHMLELLSGLHEEIVPRGDFHGDTMPGVARPDVQAWIPRAAVDGEEV